MSAPPQIAVDNLPSDYHHAVSLLKRGDISRGAGLLGQLAATTTDDRFRSQCLYNLGQILVQLNMPSEAYGIWYPLAHKSPGATNDFDLMARARVFEMFDKHALRVRPPRFPPKVQIEVTNRCNLRCVMCTRNQMERPLADFPFEAFQRIADECATEPHATIVLYYLGEPLMHPRLVDMVRYLDEIKDNSPIPLAFGVQTNGMLLTRQRAEQLIDAGLRSISISLDGLAERHETLRPGARYERIERNIIDLLKLRDERGVSDLRVEISSLTEDRESAATKDFVRVWQPRVDQVYLNPVHHVAGNAFVDAQGALKDVATTPRSDNRVYCGNGNRLLVYSNGDYGFCCSDVSGELKLGNVRDHSIRAVWNSPQMFMLRDQVVRGEFTGLRACETCELGRA